jgi:ferric-dicitrate binding protein FerR (iron transport regulator)
MEQERAYYLVDKWVKAEIESHEMVELDQWMAVSPENARQVEEIRAILEMLSAKIAAVEPQTDQAWNELFSRLNQNETPVVKLAPAAPKSKFWKVYAAAAVFLVALMGAWWMLGSSAGLEKELVYTTASGERTRLQLPDGSTVFLNGGSEFKALKGFGGKDRRVALEGEAYFQVASDAQKPFIIETFKSLTTVVGTAFNLRSYGDGLPVRLGVTEGKVKFGSLDGKSSEILAANQAAIFNPLDGKISIIPESAQEMAGWREGVLNFQEEPLASALPRLSQFYDIDIRLGKGLDDARLTARFTEKDHDAMLEILAATFSASVRRDGDVAWLEK